MASLSRSNLFSEEDEKHEIEQLSEAEKEEILDDIYGRRRRRKDTGTNNEQKQGSCNDLSTTLVGNETMNNRCGDDNGGDDSDDPEESSNVIDRHGDIPSNLLQQFFEALEEIPPDKSGAFWIAWTEHPTLVNTESDFHVFLLCEDNNPKKAAIRICEYWDMRVDIFGHELAFKPITLDGAMHSVVSDLSKIPNFCRILPNDKHGRSVIAIDRTGVSYKDLDPIVLVKVIWFAIHVALGAIEKQRQQFTRLELQQNEELGNGTVLVIVSQNSSWVDFPPNSFIQLAAKSIFSALPIKIKCIHACTTSLGHRLLGPVYKFFMSQSVRQRYQFHNNLIKPTLLNELESYGLNRKDLPGSIGGSYNTRPTWIDECERRVKAKLKRLSKNKRQREGLENTNEYESKSKK